MTTEEFENAIKYVQARASDLYTFSDKVTIDALILIAKAIWYSHDANRG